jgi:hypothetical protein
MKSGMIAAETIFDLLSKTTDENKTKGKNSTLKQENDDFIVNTFKL